MDRIKKISTVMVAIIVTTIQVNADWRKDVEKEMTLGNLQNASCIIDRLDSDTKQADKYEIDSVKAIVSRIRYDFSLTPAEGIKAIMDKRPETTTQEIARWIDNKYIETMTIDGQERWFRKAVRNLWLLNPELPKDDKSVSTQRYRKLINDAKAKKQDKLQCSNTHRAKIRYTLDVNADAVPDGEEIKVWMPVPLTTSRQKNVKILSTSHEYIPSVDSEHNTIQMKAKAKAGEKTHFEMELSYDVSAQHFTQEYLLRHIKPYKTDSDEYKKYTSADGRHIVVNEDMRNLAKSIVGEGTNPVLQSARIYNWIVTRYPWAGARDYGTIVNIPEYVLEQGHGDCGQVALLYISMLRSLGIPARWESGWMLHPWSTGWHDWAETYFEGIGWVPTDVSVGRNDDDVIRTYYKTGTDVYRFATNCDYGKPLSPKKKHIRTEPIDFQAGEAEWAGGNIEATEFDSELEVLEFTPIKEK